MGHNATLLLNFPVDRTGRINPIDSTRAVAYHQQILSDLSENLLAGIVPQGSNSRSSEWSPAHVSDGNYDSYWATADGVTSASLTFAFKKPTLLNRVLIQEYIPLGQRVKAFTIDAYTKGKWQTIDTGEETTTIGYKRILRFPTVEAEQLRIHFTDARGPLTINNVEAYFAASDQRNKDREETVAASVPSTIPYLLKGVTATETQKVYDQNPATTCFIKGNTVVFDLKKAQTISSLTYLPDQGEYPTGLISSYEVYTASKNGKPQTLIAKGEFSNIKSNPIAQAVRFAPVTTQYIVVKATRMVDNASRIGIAEWSFQK